MTYSPSLAMLGIFLIALQPCMGGDIRVPRDQPTIQSALDAALDRDRIIVEPGTYRENLEFPRVSVTLLSRLGPSNTIIDGLGNTSVVSLGEGTSRHEIQGFSITGGAANSESEGGGITCRDGSPLVVDCWIDSNTALVGGGLLAVLSTPSVFNCRFSNNNAQRGGGLALINASASLGGLRMVSNVADEGGAIYIENSHPSLTSSLILGNRAALRGGGIFVFDSFPTCRHLTILGNHGDTGGGLYSQFSEPNISDSIVWNNTASVGPQMYMGIVGQDSHGLIDYSLVQGGQSEVVVEQGSTLQWGQGMLDRDPQFANPGNNDYRLKASSPCVDSGDPNFDVCFGDLGGAPRISDGPLDGGRRSDMGAHERTPLFLVTDEVGVAGSAFNIDAQVDRPLALVLTLGLARDRRCDPQFGTLFISFTAPHWFFPWFSGPASIQLPSQLPEINLYLQVLGMDLSSGRVVASNETKIAIDP